ncbi:MAG TPA: hypothetical protein PLL30_00420 [Candidatus Krumholzibacteria bacterium]|nr:hypothetical protein [Candidatus Krumholzibacteria bacterium]HPD70223.1 hypothetical protein [Candidatus Krumholzibacteria bacterium]HRY40077.1 hypothetical protein [Candidatus Krumholzibacteria bacterium]
MAGEPTTQTIRGGDLQRGLRLQYQLLTSLEGTLRGVLPRPQSVPLRDWIAGGFDPGNWPPPIVKERGCHVRFDRWQDTGGGLDLIGAVQALKCLVQLQWCVVAALPEDHSFAVPAGIEPLGGSAAADEA